MLRTSPGYAIAPAAPCAHGVPVPLTSRPAVSGRIAGSRGLGTSNRHVARVAEIERPTVSTSQPTTADEPVFGDMSYSKQFDELYKYPLNPRVPVAKPSKEAQTLEPDGKNVFLSDVVKTPKRTLFNREWNKTDLSYGAFVGLMHIGCLFAPATFSWPMFALSMGMYFLTGCLGITLSFHRQLSHKAFQTPKWLEYALAYCGVWAAQGDPMEWASSHRYHHVHTDTPLDPHSPYEGFWWSHMGWFLDSDATENRVGARGNQADLESQWFYRFLKDTYIYHIGAMFGVLFACGGLPAVIWGGCVRLVLVYHITWFVNSASHVWGNQTYNTGDLSRNNWWVALLAFGEGWHNNHHAFEYSARHGFEWWQLDITWGVICLLKKLGLAKNVRLPTEKAKQRLAF